MATQTERQRTHSGPRAWRQAVVRWTVALGCDNPVAKLNPDLALRAWLALAGLGIRCLGGRAHWPQNSTDAANAFAKSIARFADKNYKLVLRNTNDCDLVAGGFALDGAARVLACQEQRLRQWVLVALALLE